MPNFTPNQIQFLRDNYQKMTAQQLADALGLSRTAVRVKKYELGLYAMKLEYWTEEQVSYLLKHYRQKGDTELAEIFNQKWHKEKGWTKKHIEKKRKYLNLKRTKEEKIAIREKHKKNGVFKRGNQKMWETRGVATIGTIRVWDRDGIPSLWIKTKKVWRHYPRWLWEKHRGCIKPGYVVRLKDGDPYNVTMENLELVTREENARLNREFNIENDRNKTKAIIKFNIQKIDKYEKQIERLK